MAYSNFDIKTPFFCFDLDVLDERMTYLAQLAARYDTGLCYAIKANSFLAPHMLKYTPRLEVCSLGELDICKAYGLPMEAVVLSGVNKEREYVASGISSGVGIITAESELHFQYIREEVQRIKPEHRVRVLLRLTNGSQFGMDDDILRGIIAERDRFEGIDIAGLHYFTGTQKKKLKTITKELDYLHDFLSSLRSDYGYEPEELEYGPGLWVPYFEGEDFSDNFGMYESVLQYIKEKQFPCRVTLEMGRYFTASCGEYVTGIVDVKRNRGTGILIVDGGSNHIKYHGHNMAMNTPVMEHVPAAGFSEGSIICGDAPADDIHSDTGAVCADSPVAGMAAESQKYNIYGSLCSFFDILATDYPLSAPQVGDRLIFKNMGAYSVTEGIYLFLSRDLPRIYLRRQGELTLIRDTIQSSTVNRAEGL